MDDSLSRFVHDALSQGASKKEIEETLISAGWAGDEVRSALELFADVQFPVPVPRPRPYVSAKEAFVYLVLFTLLYLSAWSLGSLLFQFIDRTFPDATRGYSMHNFRLIAIRWSVATLLISFPGYLILSWRTYKATREETEKRKSRVRKWLTYLTLFLAAGVLTGDLISLVFNLLGGELTIRFLLKVLTVGGIAGAIFGYYLWDLKQDDAEPGSAPARRPFLRVLALVVTLGVAASLLWGLFLAGSPGRARMMALDERRESDLALIANSIDTFWEQQERLPGDLYELQKMRGVFVESIEDPATFERYEYSVIGEESYELCAIFDTLSVVRKGGRTDDHRPRFWQHGAGKVCFPVQARSQ